MKSMYMRQVMMTMVLSALLMVGMIPLHGRNYKLVWKDQFRKHKIDTSYWSMISRGTSDWNRYMSDNDALYDLKCGKLVLRAVANDAVDAGDTASFLTCGICTKGKFTIGQGKVEVRVKLEAGKSVWPAIWMLPQTGKWPDSGEIDIMERLNHDEFVYQTVHTYYTHMLKHKTDPPNYKTSEIRSESYNVYGVEILQDKIVFSINGKETFAYPRIEGKEYEEMLQFPFGTPYYILIDMQTGGSWVGPADDEDLPVEMKVDWIKVYSLR